MLIHLHKQATTTPKVRAAIQASNEPASALAERFGIPFRHIEGEELAALQPGLSKQFVKATFVPGWKTSIDPKLLGKAM